MTKEAGAASPTPEPPSRIGKYTILGRIGAGAMGQVFRALDPVLNRHVAIKTMAADVSGDPQLSQRFLREAQSAAQLNHPNIVTLHDFGEDQGQLYMAMELLEGQDLSKVIKQRKLETLEDQLGLMEQACDGLAFAHSMQLVHRDLKPANIHVHTSGRVKIMDFGLARVSGSDMTRAGTIMGSPNYMSPEQVRGERADARSDVFAMGAVFYEVLSGRRAFDADAVHAILYKVANTDPEPLARVCPELSPILVELVEKALRKEPEQRFSDAVEMREALDVCRRVLDGSLDQDTGMASLREARTLIQAPALASPEPAADGSSTLSSIADTRPAIPRRTAIGSARAVRLGQSGTLPLVRPPAPTVAASPPASLAGAGGTPRMALVAAAGLAVLALLAAVFFALRPAAPPAARQPDPQAAALVALAVESQLEVARKSLEFKDLPGAASAADKALRLDPANAEAHAIKARAQAALELVETAVREARDAARAGDVEKASQAVSRVLAQMPEHGIAAELAPQLNSRFQSRAEEALRQARSAAEAARRSNASSLRGYGEGARASRQADELLAKRQFTQATQKALEAKQAYEMARAAALELAAKPAATAAAAPATTMATPPPPQPTPPAVAPPAAATQPTTLPPAPASTPVAGPSDEALVGRLLADFERAIESKDVALYKQLRPSLSGDEEKKLRAAFESVRSQEIDLLIDSLQVDGATAVVRVKRSGRINGQPVPTLQQVFRLTKGPSGWLIRDIQ